MLKTKTSAVLSLGLVFVSGSLLGALAYRAYTVGPGAASPTNQRKLSPSDWRKRNLAEMRTRLKLDDQQAAKLDQIFDKFDDDYRQVGAKRRTEDQASPGTLSDKIKKNLTESRDKFGIDDHQVAQIDQLIDQINQDFRDVMTKRRAEDLAYQNALVGKIDNILRPDQKVLYQQLRDEREKERERRRLQGPSPGGPNGGPNDGPGRGPMGGSGGPHTPQK